MRINWLDLQSTLNGALRCFGKGSVKYDENAYLGDHAFSWGVDKTNKFFIKPDRAQNQAFFDLHAVEIELMVREAIHQIAAKIAKVEQK